MADIANLGFRADTAELADAKAKLEQIVPAAGKAERAAQRLDQMLDNVGASATGAGAKVNQMAAGLDATAASANKAAAGLNNAASASKRAAAGVVAANQNIVASGNAMKANTANIAAQFQDIGVTAAMGMSPLQIALQQGTQLSAIFAAQAGGLRGVITTLGAAFATVLSPVSLLTIAIVGLSAAGLQLVNWTGLAQFALTNLAAILPQVAAGVTAVGAAIALAFAPAIVSTFFSLFLAAAAGIVTAVGGIVAAVGAIPLAIGLIIADLYIFRDEWEQVLGFDLINVVKQGVNLIIGAFVGAYHDIAFVWKQFPNVIGAAAIGAANMAIRAVNAIIAASVNGLNALIASIQTVFKLGGAVGAGMDVKGSLGKVGEGGIKAPQFDEIANEAADALSGAVGERNTQLQEDLTKDYLGAIGGAITAGAERASVKIKEFSAGLSLGDVKGAKGGGGGGGSAGGKSATESFQDIVSGAERSIASLQAEREAIGMSAEATARLKYETQLLNEAKQKNIDLTPTQREQLLGLAADMANLESETKRAKDALDFTKDATKGFVSDLKAGLQEGKSLWESFVNAALNLADKLIDHGLNAIIDKLFEVNSASSGLGGATGGGGGGLLGGLLGGIGKLFGGLFSAKGNVFNNGVQAFASGGAFTNSVVSKPTLFQFANGGALGVMGEAGPEAIMPLKRGPNGSLGVEMHGATSANAQPAQNTVEVNNNYTIAGAVSEKSLVEQIRATAEQTKSDVKQQMMGWLGEYDRNGIMST